MIKTSVTGTGYSVEVFVVEVVAAVTFSLAADKEWNMLRVRALEIPESFSATM